MRLCILQKQRPLKLTSNIERKRHGVYCQSNNKSIASDKEAESDLSRKRVAVIIGGTGRVGQSTASSLIKNMKDIKIIMGGRSKENYKSIISKNKQFQNKTEFIKVDINDINSIKEAIEGKDIVIHTAGPFQKREDCNVLEAAIETKTPYIDVCDDLEYSQRAKKYHEKAKEAGIPAITTTGVYPGLSNIMSAHILSLTNDEYNDDGTINYSLNKEIKEEVERIRFSYFTAGSGGAGQTLLVTSNMLLAEPVTVYANDKKLIVPAFHQPMEVDFGQNLGKKLCYLLNLPEVESCRNVYNVPNISARFGTSPIFWNWILWFMAHYIPKDILSNKESMTRLAMVSEPFIRFFDFFVGEKLGIRIDVIFKNKKSSCALYIHDSLSRSVGICTAAFARCVLDGESMPGVWFPEEKEAILKRKRFLTYAAEGCRQLVVNRPTWEIDSDPIQIGLGFYL